MSIEGIFKPGIGTGEEEGKERVGLRQVRAEAVGEENKAVPRGGRFVNVEKR